MRILCLYWVSPILFRKWIYTPLAAAGMARSMPARMQLRVPEVLRKISFGGFKVNDKTPLSSEVLLDVVSSSETRTAPRQRAPSGALGKANMLLLGASDFGQQFEALPGTEVERAAIKASLRGQERGVCRVVGN